MSGRVFLTGAGGFVGRRVLDALDREGWPVVALDRSGTLRPSASGRVTVVRGDLLEPASYRDALRGCDAVLHLAAAIGRASAGDHFRVNARGTEVLVDECRRAGAGRFLFVSSIATTFPDLRGYHYARAKSQAEGVVRRSGLRFLILRPAMILGHGAPILRSLGQLATLPVAVLPGNGRARVQPIHVDDVVACLLAALRLDAFDNEAVDIGGPDTVSMEDLLRRIRAARVGRPGPLLRVPLPLLQWPLRAFEAAGLGGLLPITAGQLTSFRFDGVARANRLQESIGGSSRHIDEMVAVAAEPPARPQTQLEPECRMFTRYLLGREPSEYLVSKYRAAHDAQAGLAGGGRFDRFLVDFARRGTLFARVADAYAALFAPSSLLRKKLVMLLAILETCAPFCEWVDAPVGGAPMRAMARIGVAGLAGIASLAAGTLILLPVRLAMALRPGGAR